MTLVTKQNIVRRAILLAGALLVLSGAIPLLRKALADELPQVKISAAGVAPRELEQATGESLVREYATAWKNLATALDENRTDLLNDDFVGTAKSRLEDEIASQRKNSLHQRTVDHGHQVDAVFYSSDGSAIELRDTAQLETQLLDGGKVVASRETPVHYLALLTVSDGRWKVRELVAIPEFSK
jgi:hypothetical protein